MPPLDALQGWDDPESARQYGAFAASFPMYRRTSRDLASRASLDDASLVVDLCCGTGVTTAAILESLPGDGRVVGVDAAAAMIDVARSTVLDSRVEWAVAPAESLAEVMAGRQADVVLCNSALWKTDVAATLLATRRCLRTGGRLIFNVGAGFLGLATAQPLAAPSITDYVNALAVVRYGLRLDAPAKGSKAGLSLDRLATSLFAAGFTSMHTEVVTHTGTLEEKYAWLSLPMFARPAGPFSHDERMALLTEAYQLVDKDRPERTDWVVITAQAGRARPA